MLNFHGMQDGLVVNLGRIPEHDEGVHWRNT
jgi:hypothetical protein